MASGVFLVTNILAGFFACLIGWLSYSKEGQKAALYVEQLFCHVVRAHFLLAWREVFAGAGGDVPEPFGDMGHMPGP